MAVVAVVVLCASITKRHLIERPLARRIESLLATAAAAAANCITAVRVARTARRIGVMANAVTTSADNSFYFYLFAVAVAPISTLLART